MLRLLVVLGAVVAVALPLDGPAQPGRPALVGTAAKRAGAEAAAAARTAGGLPFAHLEGLALVLPSRDVRVVAFHEAAFADALPLVPAGTVTVNDNPTKFAAAAPVTPDAPDAYVLSSRGRPHAATSAVDVVLNQGVAVRSLVSGTVARVQPYLLYGRYDDTRVEVVPDARPDLVVVMIHLRGVAVRPGQRVTAGETVLAGSAARFPFRSQVDRYVRGDAAPHVHVEVKRASSP